MVSRLVLAGALLAVTTTTAFASAEEAERERPYVRHQAPSLLTERKSKSVQIYVQDKPGLASVELWVSGRGASRMESSDEDGWYHGELTPSDGVAELAYAIELVWKDGRREAVFASRKAPYRVLVEDDPEIDVVAELEADVDGRHDVIYGDFVWGNWGSAGTTVLEPSDLGIDVPRRVEVPDRFWTTGIGYRHRFHGAVHHLGLRLEGMRAEVPVQGQLGDEPQARGYNLVRGDLALRWWRYGLLVVEPALGFYGDSAVGGGEVSLRFGRIYGSGLQVGGGWLHGVGGRFFSRVELGGAGTDVPWLRAGSTFAITDAPDPGRWGLQATADLRIDPGAGFTLRARGGYQTRMDGAGGPIVGGGVDYAF